MSLCNLAGECQSKSGSARFVGDKWLEDTFHLLRSDSAAGIGTGDGNDISAAGSCQMNGALFGDGFLCIFQQFRTSSCSLILSPVNSPRESEIEEENSISASFVSSEIAKEIATFFKSCSIEKTE